MGSNNLLGKGDTEGRGERERMRVRARVNETRAGEGFHYISLLESCNFMCDGVMSRDQLICIIARSWCSSFLNGQREILHDHSLSSTILVQNHDGANVLHCHVSRP